MSAPLDARLKYLANQIAALVAGTGTSLTSVYWISPLIPGRILAGAGDIARFATKDKFASYNGTAPIDVSSGEQVRHRLSRAGNRRVSHALHMMAVTQIRYPATPGRVYYERKRKEGKTPKEALRCLKRRLSAWRSSTQAAACTPASSRKPKPPSDGATGSVPAPDH